MKKSPLISVIVPNYNHAKYLDERLLSILQQTYENYELIILDDNSTDNSKKIIEKYRQNPHVAKVVYNETNSGSPFKQWEKGFELSKGDYIWIAESDDKCESTFLEQIVCELERHECILCFCRTILIDSNGQYIAESGIDENLYIEGSRFIKHYLSKWNYVRNASSAVFKRNVLPNIDKTYAQFKSIGDWLFWVEVSGKGPVSYINSSLNYYRQHNNNTIGKQIMTGNTEVETQKIILYMYEKGYINCIQLFRNKVIQIYKLKYGKLKGFYPKEVENEIIRTWHLSIIVKLTIVFLYLLKRMGITIVKW